MKATQLLHDLGQSVWLDNITRDLLDSGTLKRYIDELSVTGLTSNPTIFDHAIKNSAAYDAAIRQKVYVKALAAPFTVNTMPEGTLKALADHGALGAILPADGGDGEEVLATFASAGVNVDALASQLQDEGARSFVDSWRELMDVIAAKSSDLAKAS